EEHDSVARSKIPISTFDLEANILAKIAAGAHRIARGLVEFTHLGIGVGENDAAGVGVRLPVAIPPLDQLAARLFARLGRMDHVALRIGVDRLAGSSRGEMPRGVLLPAFMLAANLRNLDAAMPFVDRPERRARLDRLQLLRVADQ